MNVPLIRGVMAGGQEGPWSLQYFQNCGIFRHFNALSENFCTFAVAIGKGFECYWKIFELGPLIYRCRDAPAVDIDLEFMKITLSDTDLQNYCI